MRIRPFRPDDAPALAALFHAAVHAVGARDYAPEQRLAWSPQPPDPARYLEQAADGRLLLVAVDDSDALVGYADLEGDGRLDHLYRHPGHAGRGVGAALVGAVERAAMERGLARIHVEASEPARRLLERLGFTVEGRRDFSVNGVAIHNYAMSKALA